MLPSTPWLSAQAAMTAPSLTQYTSTSSIPCALSLSCCSRYPGTCVEDHVGVKAPGRPTRMTFLPFTRSARLTFTPSEPAKPWSSSMAGILEPT